jgi:hypothetical protein
MENVVHKIYHLTFPNNDTYVGSTSQTFRKRYTGYRSAYKKSKSPICEISTQYMFDEVKMVEVNRIECPMYDSRITILEEEWIKKLNPTLNINRAHRSEEENKILWKKWVSINREHLINYDKEYSKTPLVKLNKTINNAKEYIKKFTKQNRPDMVKKWEGILEERIQNRLAHQSK